MSSPIRAGSGAGDCSSCRPWPRSAGCNRGPTAPWFGPRSRSEVDDFGFETRAIHAGQPPDPCTGAVTVPVYQTSTYAQPGLDDDPEYSYARTANPTRRALERCLASLEGAAHGIAFASGMAATDAILRRLGPAD